MAPSAVDGDGSNGVTQLNGHSTGTQLKATAPAFHPSGTPDRSRYHASTSEEAIHAEHEYAAHNYHPLPVVFARALGTTGSRGSTIPRLPLRILSRESGPLPPRIGESPSGTGVDAHTQLEGILQRCLPPVRRVRHKVFQIRHGSAHEHWCRSRRDRHQDRQKMGLQI